jgi:hypothetical protein
VTGVLGANSRSCDCGELPRQAGESFLKLSGYENKRSLVVITFDAVNAMLLNEFLKAHQKIDEQGATIAKQQKQIEALTAGLQKVSAQLELSKPAAQTVNNNH